MINYWWVTRPKRKLNSIPEVLTTFSELSLEKEWQGQRGAHLSLEDALEEAGLKRVGERRDNTGGGGRTYATWVKSLGLIFMQESTNKIKLTLTGEAIMAGDSPVEVLKYQILKYQFPSAYSIGRGINVSSRFKIRPFRFLLRLLSDSRLDYYLTEEEIAKIVIVEAEDETEKCYKYIVEKILEYRSFSDVCLEEDFAVKYESSKGEVNYSKPFNHLLDISNTIVNWIEYTQLAKRDEDKKLVILEDKKEEVRSILAFTPPFIDRPDQQEYFQRKFGVDPKHTKDTRNLTETKTITSKIIAEHMIKKAFITESLKKPIVKITTELVEKIIYQTGMDAKFVEETLIKYYPHGAIGSFMTEYFEMAFKGRDDATDFEKATVELYQKVFGFQAKHVGPIGLTPDVLILSDTDGYKAIIDNKAYSRYTISNDHHNRMVYNYIQNIGNYSNSTATLAFFTYIAGGFGKNINSQIKDIFDVTGVSGSAMSVSNMIKLVESYEPKHYTHKNIRDIFSVNKQILLSDIL